MYMCVHKYSDLVELILVISCASFTYFVCMYAVPAHMHVHVQYMSLVCMYSTASPVVCFLYSAVRCC